MCVARGGPLVTDSSAASWRSAATARRGAFGVPAGDPGSACSRRRSLSAGLGRSAGCADSAIATNVTRQHLRCSEAMCSGRQVHTVKPPAQPTLIQARHLPCRRARTTGSGCPLPGRQSSFSAYLTADLARVRPGPLSRWVTTMLPSVLVGEQSSGTRDGAEVLPLSARAVSRPGVKIPGPGRFHRFACSSPPSDTQSGGTSPFSEHRLNTRTARLTPAASPRR